jgi:hypothetical protein
MDVQTGVCCFEGCMQKWKLAQKCIVARYKDIGWAKVPNKVFCHFPLLPRLKRIFRVHVLSNSWCGIMVTIALMAWFGMWLIAKLGHILMLGS